MIKLVNCDQEKHLISGTLIARSTRCKACTRCLLIYNVIPRCSKCNETVFYEWRLMK